MLHAEEYLRHVIDAHGLRVRYLGMKFKLVRPVDPMVVQLAALKRAANTVNTVPNDATGSI